jgi:hypothetical protein
MTGKGGPFLRRSITHGHEDALREALRAKCKGSALQKTGQCPDEETLAAYLLRQLSSAEIEKLEGHIAGCPYCIDALLVTGEVCAGVTPGDHCARSAARYRWLIASVVLLALSIVFFRFFLVFLACACVCGLAGVLQTEGMRRLLSQLGSPQGKASRRDTTVHK